MGKKKAFVEKDFVEKVVLFDACYDAGSMNEDAFFNCIAGVIEDIPTPIHIAILKSIKKKELEEYDNSPTLDAVDALLEKLSHCKVG